MNALSSACPSAETLQAYALGKLDSVLAEAVIFHLENCPRCREEAQQVTADSFLDRLRDAFGPGATPAPNPVPGLSRSREAGPLTDVSPASAVPPELAELTHLYEDFRELGRGGMGVVYLARNKDMKRLEVLKVMNKDLRYQPDSVARFRREFQSAGVLSHPNIVTVFAVLPLSEQLGFAMEYVQGEDLEKVVRARGPLQVAEACGYARQVAKGLQHAFEKKMVHRDIKPSNLILSWQGSEPVVKILDFGIVKVAYEKGEDGRITVGPMGTPHYMAPEQARNAAKADIRSDVYSLGCTLYHLLAGHPPFSGKSHYDIQQAHQSEEAQPLHVARPGVPKELSAVVRKMMAKDPAQRYQSPAEVEQALTPFTTPVPQPKAKPRKLRRWAGVAVTLLLIGLVSAWASGLFKGKTKDGTIVLENVPADAEVQVEGQTVTLTRNGKVVTVSAVAEGPHKLKVVLGGREVWSSDVTVKLGGNPVRLKMEPIPGKPAPKDGAAADDTASAYDPTGGYRFVHFGPDGPRVVLRSNKQKQYFARVYDLATGQPLTPPFEHGDWVHCASFSLDGKRVVTASTDKTARVWDAVTGQPVTRPLKHAGAVLHASLSPDGKRVVTAGGGAGQVWDATTGEAITPPFKHDSGVLCATFSPDGKKVVTASVDKTARVWDAATGEAVTPPLKHESSVLHASFSPDGTRVVTASSDKTARVWDVAGGEELTPPLKHEDQVRHATFSPDGTQVVTASSDGRSWIETKAGWPSVVHSPRGIARVWDAKTGELLTSLKCEDDGPFLQVSFSQDGKRVITGSSDWRAWTVAEGGAAQKEFYSPRGIARVWNAKTGDVLTSFKHDDGGTVLQAMFNPDCTRLVTVSEKTTARVWDAATGEELKKVTIAPE
jgi:serine/threonine protein kinase/WD40 repeat protein